MAKIILNSQKETSLAEFDLKFFSVKSVLSVGLSRTSTLMEREFANAPLTVRESEVGPDVRFHTANSLINLPRDFLGECNCWVHLEYNPTSLLSILLPNQVILRNWRICKHMQTICKNIKIACQHEHKAAQKDDDLNVFWVQWYMIQGRSATIPPLILSCLPAHVLWFPRCWRRLYEHKQSNEKEKCSSYTYRSVSALASLHEIKQNHNIG